MRWEDERYVRVYTRDTVEWEMLPWESRALWPLLLRKLDRAGLLELGKHGSRGLAATVKLPHEVVEPGLAGLLDDGCVDLRGTTLVVPNFIEAQETPASPALRAKDYRERRRVDARDEIVTKRDDGITKCDATVTETNASSRAVTHRHSVPIRAVPNHEESESTRACVRDRLKAGFAEVGIPMPDAQTFVECKRLVTDYAEATDRDGGEVADEAFLAAKKLSASWSVKRLTPALFVKHWDAIQQVMSGADPTPKRNGRGPPEPVARTYDDFGAIADRITEPT